MINYFDQYGNMRMHHKIEVENGIKFRARYEIYYAYWSSLNGPYVCSISAKTAISAATDFYKSFESKRYIANPPNQTDHFSRDNMNGLYEMIFIYRPGYLEKLPLVFWNNRKGTEEITPWRHPNGINYYLSLRSKFLSWLCFPALFIMMAYSFYDTWKNPTDTSGTCLWFDALPLLAKQNIIWSWIYRYMKSNHMDWINQIYDYYCSNGHTWNNSDNPIRDMIRRANG